MIAEVPQRVYRKKRRFWPFGPAPTYDSQMSPLGYEQLVSTAAGNAQRAKLVPPGCDRYMLNVEGGSVRYLDNGEDAQVGRGMLFPVGTSVFMVADPRFISVCGESGAATVNLLYYRGGDGGQVE